MKQFQRYEVREEANRLHLKTTEPTLATEKNTALWTILMTEVWLEYFRQKDRQ